MTWTQQRQLVKALSARVQEKKRDAVRVHGNLKAWTTNYLGSPETLAWMFALGSFWAAGRSPETVSSAKRRSLVATINTSLLAWQLVNRQVKLIQPGKDNSAETLQ
jgi:hypothetical protein